MWPLGTLLNPSSKAPGPNLWHCIRVRLQPYPFLTFEAALVHADPVSGAHFHTDALAPPRPPPAFLSRTVTDSELEYIFKVLVVLIPLLAGVTHALNNRYNPQTAHVAYRGK